MTVPPSRGAKKWASNATITAHAKITCAPSRSRSQEQRESRRVSPTGRPVVEASMPDAPVAPDDLSAPQPRRPGPHKGVVADCGFADAKVHEGPRWVDPPGRAAKKEASARS